MQLIQKGLSGISFKSHILGVYQVRNKIPALLICKEGMEDSELHVKIWKEANCGEKVSKIREEYTWP